MHPVIMKTIPMPNMTPCSIVISLKYLKKKMPLSTEMMRMDVKKTGVTIMLSNALSALYK